MFLQFFLGSEQTHELPERPLMCFFYYFKFRLDFLCAETASSAQLRMRAVQREYWAGDIKDTGGNPQSTWRTYKLLSLHMGRGRNHT